MSKLDPFTLNVLCNPEVIEVDQDILGECGRVILGTENTFVMIKHLYDGSFAVGLFNRGTKDEIVGVTWQELGISGKYVVRDLWHQKNLGLYKGTFSTKVSQQGVVLVKISKRRIKNDR